MCECMPHVCGCLRRQKVTCNPQNLELLVVMSHPTQSLGREPKFSRRATSVFRH